MYKAAKKKAIRRYMEALVLDTGAPTVHWEDNTSCILVVEDKIVTPRVKKIHYCLFSTKKILQWSFCSKI